MAGHTKKWEQLYKSTMKWQARARAKERRLRKQGITNVDEFSPVKTPKELQAMTYAELSRYRHDLNVFSDRNTRFVSLPTGEGISEKGRITLDSGETITGREWAKLQRAVKRANAPRVRFFESLRGVKLSPALEAQREQMMMRTMNPRTGAIEVPAFGESDYGVLRMNTLPWTRKAFEQRQRYVKRFEQLGAAQVAAEQRESARAILGQYGDVTADRLQSVLDSLTDSEFLTLTQVTSFFDSIKLKYISEADYTAGRLSPADLVMSQDLDSELESVIDNARAIKNAGITY